MYGAVSMANHFSSPIKGKSVGKFCGELMLNPLQKKQIAAMKKTMAKIGARDALRIFSPIEFLTEFMREKTRCSRGSFSISLSAAFASESDQLPASLSDSEAKKLITLARPSGMLMFEAVTTSLENITFQLNESSMILANSVWASPRTQGRQSPPWSRSIKNDAISSGFRAPPLAARQGIKNTIRNTVIRIQYIQTHLHNIFAD